MPCGCKKGSGMYVRGGGFKKKRRKKRKGGGFTEAMFNPLGAAIRAGVGAFSTLRGRRAAQGRFVGTKRGSGARFLPGVTWHRGSGMGFSGAGMNFSGSGLRGKRMLYRRGSGRRMV